MADDLGEAAGASDGRAGLRLSEYLPYRLSLVSNRVSDLIARAYQTRFGLSVPEWRVIAMLGERAPMTAQGLVEATAMDKVTVSRALRGLDARGLVSRTPNPDDRRASDVRLTGEGRAIYAEVAPLALDYERALLETFSADERAQLSRLLDRLAERVEVAGSTYAGANKR